MSKSAVCNVPDPEAEHGVGNQELGHCREGGLAFLQVLLQLHHVQNLTRKQHMGEASDVERKEAKSKTGEESNMSDINCIKSRCDVRDERNMLGINSAIISKDSTSNTAVSSS